MKYVMTIRQAEGGQDSRLFCKDLYKAYVKLATAINWTVS